MARRLLTALVLWLLTAAALVWAAPSPHTVFAAAGDPQRWIGLHGVDAAIVTVAVAVCWLLLGWLALGLLIGLAAQLPGAAGRTADVLAAVVLPRAIRQAVALTLGVGLATAGASAAAADPAPAGVTSVAASVDWPVRPPAQPPSVPSPPEMPPPARGGPPGFGDPINTAVVVASGDSLWMIAAARLGADATPGQIADDVADWYQVNRDVIGPDPDLIHPGQRLVPPTTS